MAKDNHSQAAQVSMSSGRFGFAKSVLASDIAMTCLEGKQTLFDTSPPSPVKTIPINKK